jgi:ABC-type multidrug transport system fused ATPase/permease subunit
MEAPQKGVAASWGLTGKHRLLTVYRSAEAVVVGYTKEKTGDLAAPVAEGVLAVALVLVVEVPRSVTMVVMVVALVVILTQQAVAVGRGNRGRMHRATLPETVVTASTTPISLPRYSGKTVCLVGVVVEVTKQVERLPRSALVE